MEDQAWRNRVMVLGGVLGTLAGIGAAMLYMRAEEEALEEERSRPPQHKPISPVALLPIALGVLGVMREIVRLTDRD
ncbi:MAG TPA: hypothetical protein VJ793_20205 [Anaerolineae bacterium]|nr:hypothetical protein [Anaerolineae bacterium]